MKSNIKYAVLIVLLILSYVFFSLIPSTVTQKKSNYNDVLDYNLTLDVSENNSKEQNFPYNIFSFSNKNVSVGLIRQ